MLEQMDFKGIWLSNDVLQKTNLNDKEKIIYSMILALSKKQKCIATNSYISRLFNITKVQVSRIINSLKTKGFIKIEMIHKQNSKAIIKRIITPIKMNDSTYQQIGSKDINIDVKDIINNNNINYNYYKW